MHVLGDPQPHFAPSFEARVVPRVVAPSARRGAAEAREIRENNVASRRSLEFEIRRLERKDDALIRERELIRTFAVAQVIGDTAHTPVTDLEPARRAAG